MDVGALMLPDRGRLPNGDQSLSQADFVRVCGELCTAALLHGHSVLRVEHAGVRREAIADQVPDDRRAHASRTDDVDRLHALPNVNLVHLPFFFQAEDGIRDLTVTGVQTCAPSDLKLFDELHAAIFGRPAVDADRIVLANDIYNLVLAQLDSMSNQLFGKYGLTRYLIIYLLREKIGRASCRERV